MAGKGRGARLVAGAVAGFVLVTAGFGLTYNTTASLPPGVYRIRPLDSEPARGQVVAFCLPAEAARLALARGYVHPQGLEPYVYGTRCTSGAGVIGKPVAGIPGDTIEVGARGVLVNGRLLQRSRVPSRDRAGRPLPSMHGRRVLGPKEFWLQSEFAQNSFDSRVFGPVPRDSILDRRIFLVGFGPAVSVAVGILAGCTLVHRPRRNPPMLPQS